VFINEVVSGADSVSSLAEFNSTCSETAAAVDTTSAGARFVASLLETVTATDTPSRRLLWEVIDDDQTPSWTLIDTI
jgi:hypothetical protein